jgi:hypothetical protein
LVTETLDIYIEAHAEGTHTDMAQAIAEARRIAETWITADPKRVRSSFPPVVLNITDGQHNTGGDPLEEARRLRELRTNDGATLLFNCHFTTNSSALLAFPAAATQFASLGLVDDPPSYELSWAGTMFNMSSPVPETMMRRATEAFKMPLPAGSRGMIYNADTTDLIDFLDWGTLQMLG